MKSRAEMRGFFGFLRNRERKDAKNTELAKKVCNTQVTIDKLHAL